MSGKLNSQKMVKTSIRVPSLFVCFASNCLFLLKLREGERVEEKGEVNEDFVAVLSLKEGLREVFKRNLILWTKIFKIF